MRTLTLPMVPTIHRATLMSACLTLLFGCVERSGEPSTPGRAPLTEREATFLEDHWRPIEPQGSAPRRYSTLEASLAPEACGACHPRQFEDWRASLHAKAMGPGVLGQLIEMGSAQAVLCQRCHAPLAEQMPEAATDERDVALRGQGLVCAACHVRSHRRFGPPPGTNSIAMTDPDVPLPHDGFVVETAFTKAAFCRGCHQFEASEYALNGKLLENTYEEWRASAYPAQGIHCQDCHMPERRHLWRGIHDPETVAGAVEIHATMPSAELMEGDVVAVTITVANTGVGHYFPTYVTPKVFLRGELLREDGTVMPATIQQAVIGREVPLDLSQEVFDTRIAPGEERSVTYEQRVPPGAEQLRVTVEVHPDHFYHRFFEAVLAGGGGGEGRALLEQALADTEASKFTLYQDVFALRRDLRDTNDKTTVELPQSSGGTESDE
ncbi:MAG: multiheme c-type cytochrome [Gammaproteobacteria bacterium]